MPYKMDQKEKEVPNKALSQQDSLEERRKYLQGRLDSFYKKRFLNKKQEKQNMAISGAFRLAVDFFSAIIVGVVLGFGFDKLLHSFPWGTVVFVFLGFVAGVFNILRSS